MNRRSEFAGMSKQTHRDTKWLIYRVIAVAAGSLMWIGHSLATTPDLETSDRTTPTALPADGTPVAEMFDMLDARARAGDAVAACRLGAELERCRYLQITREAIEASRAASLAVHLTDETAQIEEPFREYEHDYQDLELLCADVPMEKRPASAPYFDIAAGAGHYPSMSEFILAFAHSIDGSADPELSALFRRNGPGHFLRAFEAGDPGALALMILANMDEPTGPLSLVIPERLREPKLVFALSERLQASTLLGTVSRLLRFFGNDPLADQRADAEELFQAHFASSTRWQDQFLHRRADNSPTSLARYRCNDW